jgi:hypothetical protein
MDTSQKKDKDLQLVTSDILALRDIIKERQQMNIALQFESEHCIVIGTFLRYPL